MSPRALRAPGRLPPYALAGCRHTRWLSDEVPVVIGIAGG